MPRVYATLSRLLKNGLVEVDTFMLDHDAASLELISRAFAGQTEGPSRDDVLDNKGGHFAAWEQPELLAEEVRAGFRTLR